MNFAKVYTYLLASVHTPSSCASSEKNCDIASLWASNFAKVERWLFDTRKVISMAGYKKRKEMEQAARRREEFIRRHMAEAPAPGKILQFRKDENV